MHEGFPVPEVTPKEKERKSPFTFEHAELNDETALALAEYVRNSINTPQNYIDKGGAGSVFRIAEGLCMKVMTPRRFSPHAALLDIGNHPVVEANILRSRASRIVSGVRVPYCYGFLEAKHGEDFDYLLMEELDAVNLQRVISKKIPAPEAFNAERFVEALDAYIQDLHSSGIAHGDLEARNVMIDRKTGLPRLIDFGRSRLLGRLSIAERNAAIAHDEKIMNQAITEPLFKDID